MSGNTLVDSALEILQNVGPVVVDVSVNTSVILVVMTDVIDVQFILKQGRYVSHEKGGRPYCGLTLHPMSPQ